MNSSNELTALPSTTFNYDNNGNMTSKVQSTGASGYTWDFNNRLSSVVVSKPDGTTTTVMFKYDPFGRRIEKASPSGTTIYLYDGANITSELNSAGAYVASYTQGLGVDAPLAMQRGGYVEYYQADGLGSITSMTGSSGGLAATYSYDSFGNTTATEGIFNPFRYTGREQDPETGIYYYRARYYDPAIGRFISEDPIGFGGGINKYAYVGNGPTRYIDPLGLYSSDDLLWDSANFSTGFANNITFGIFNFGKCVVNHNSGWYKAGEVAGVAWQTAIGGAIGSEIGDANALDSTLTRPNPAFPRGIERVESSHWISQFKNTALDGEWNLKEMWGTDHALNDPARYRFLKTWWKKDNEINSFVVRQWNLMPTWAQGAGIGMGLGAGSAAADRGCGCH